MVKTRADVDAALDSLAEWVPVMLADEDEATRLDVFEDALDALLRETALADRHHAWTRAQHILHANGLKRRLHGHHDDTASAPATRCVAD